MRNGYDDDVIRPKTYRPVDNVMPPSVDDTGHLPNLLIYQRCNKTLGYVLISQTILGVRSYIKRNRIKPFILMINNL